MGTCRMGCSPSSSVCDASGQCWEVYGLYVADASAFPTSSGANPMITAEALAHCVALDIAQRWSTGQQGKAAGGQLRKRAVHKIPVQAE